MKKNNSQSIKAYPEPEEGDKNIAHKHLTSAEHILVVLLGFGFILGFLLTPN